MQNRLTKLLTLLLTMVLAYPLSAQSQQTVGSSSCAFPGYLTDVRPDSSGPPTEVIMGMRLMDLTEINDENQTISLDVAVRMQWTDSRLAALDGCMLPKDAVWFPELVMKNSGRIFERWPQTVSIEKGGKVTYLQRMSGTFSSYQNLADFPFDDQSTSLRFHSLHWSPKKLTFRNDDVFTGISTPLNISDWSVDNVKITVADERFEALQQDRVVYVLTIPAKRDVGYYVWKILLPIGLIVAMSWCVFWIDPKQLGTQLGLSATSFLTMVAFIFATTNMMPKLGYVTTLDISIAGATGFVFVAMVQSLSTGFLSAQGRADLAKKLDQISRIAFPVLFLLFCAVIYLTRV
jgi:hypothetical protein